MFFTGHFLKTLNFWFNPDILMLHKVIGINLTWTLQIQEALVLKYNSLN